MALFKGKTVALTCSAPHILEIDHDFSQYDLVCRVNSQLPLTDEMIAVTGDRCDVWYPAKRILQECPHLCEYADLIRCPPRYRKYIPKQYRDRFSKLQVKRGVIKKAIQSGPNRGLLAAIDILMGKPGKLFIAGMGFYQRGDYYKGYDSINPVDPEKKGNDLGHNQQRSMAYFVENVLPYCEVDDVMREILTGAGY